MPLYIFYWFTISNDHFFSVHYPLSPADFLRNKQVVISNPYKVSAQGQWIVNTEKKWSFEINTFRPFTIYQQKKFTKNVKIPLSLPLFACGLSDHPLKVNS